MATRQSVNPVYSRGYLTGVLTGLNSDDTTLPLAAPSLRLFTGSVNPTPDTPLATFTENIATFSGYANASPTISPSVVAPSELTLARYLAALFVLATADPLVQNTITGYYLVQGTTLVMAERFAAGQEVQMGSVGDFLDLAVLLPFPFRPGI